MTMQQYETDLLEKLIERADIVVNHLWVPLLQVVGAISTRML